MDFHQPSLNDKFHLTTYYFVCFLRRWHQIIQLWKHLCSPLEGHPISTNIKSITWLTGCPSRYWLVQITLYQMTQLPKDACGPYRFKDFLGIFYYIKSWSRELHIKPNAQLETVLGERRAMSMHCSKILLKDFCNSLSVFSVYHRGFSLQKQKLCNMWYHNNFSFKGNNWNGKNKMYENNTFYQRISKLSRTKAPWGWCSI